MYSSMTQYFEIISYKRTEMQWMLGAGQGFLDVSHKSLVRAGAPRPFRRTLSI